MKKRPQPKFKTGDKVLIIDDMRISRKVETVFFKEHKKEVAKDGEPYSYIYLSFTGTSPQDSWRVVLDDGKTYEEWGLTFYSEPLQNLSEKYEALKEKVEKLENPKIKTKPWIKRVFIPF